jgi:hypothetical protein
VALLLAAQPSPAPAAGEDEARLGRDICFEGKYQALPGRRGQGRSIRKILASLRSAPADSGGLGYALAMTIERAASRDHLALTGRCAFGERANQEGGGKALFPGASDAAGFRCSVAAEGEPQNEGDKLLILLGANFRSATLYLPERFATRSRKGEAAAANPVESPASERALKLANVYPENCSALSASQPK